MKVVIDNSFSDTEHLKFGVPRGSCAGPVIFTMYIAALKILARNTILNSMDMQMTIKLRSKFKLEMLKVRQLLSNNSVIVFRTLFFG